MFHSGSHDRMSWHSSPQHTISNKTNQQLFSLSVCTYQTFFYGSFYLLNKRGDHPSIEMTAIGNTVLQWLFRTVASLGFLLSPYKYSPSCSLFFITVCLFICPIVQLFICVFFYLFIVFACIFFCKLLRVPSLSIYKFTLIYPPSFIHSLFHQ
ncbi:hypothetical protein BDF14DRAFT_1254616 [Spinellus fusiger]|nr:hypothetical protein BDF14DRAFT_1254616 [Spinellus fusiger]